MFIRSSFEKSASLTNTTFGGGGGGGGGSLEVILVCMSCPELQNAPYSYILMSKNRTY